MNNIPCTVVCNTKMGYCMTPKKCSSIKEALQYARDLGMAYRIFDENGKLIKSGWTVD